MNETKTFNSHYIVWQQGAELLKISLNWNLLKYYHVIDLQVFFHPSSELDHLNSTKHFQVNKISWLLHCKYPNCPTGFYYFIFSSLCKREGGDLNRVLGGGVKAPPSLLVFDTFMFKHHVLWWTSFHFVYNKPVILLTGRGNIIFFFKSQHNFFV